MPYFIYHSELCRRLLVIIAAIYLMPGVYGHGLADAAGNRVNAVALEALLEQDTLAVRVSRDGACRCDCVHAGTTRAVFR